MTVAEQRTQSGPTRTKRRHASDALGRRILNGEVQPGEQLPNESDLVAELGVGRGAVREAVKALEAKGLLESRPRTGTRIKSRDQWNFLDADVLRWMGVTRPDRLAEELSELRGAIEPQAAALAARRATKEDLDAIVSAYHRMSAAALNESATFVEADMDFHLAILQATHNDLFISLGHAIGVALFDSFQKGMEAPGAVRASLPRHDLVLNAIRVGDGHAASAAALGLVATSMHDISVAGPWENA